MGNDIAKAIKQKTDSQWRMNSREQTPSTYEGATGIVHVTDPKVYMTPYVAGKNITFGTAGDKTTINAVMNLLAGKNITISSPDANGQVTITGTISGKGINITDFADKNGFVVTYDLVSDKFILTESMSSVSQATELELGGIRAKTRTTESSEAAIDPSTGKIYVSNLSAGSDASSILTKPINVTDFVGKDGYVFAYDETNGTIILKKDESTGGGGIGYASKNLISTTKNILEIMLHSSNTIIPV